MAALFCNGDERRNARVMKSNLEQTTNGLRTPSTSSNKGMNQTKTALLLAAAAFAGYPWCSADVL